MKERLTTFGSAVAALILVIILLSPPPKPPQTAASFPTSTDNGRYGLLGLKRWLDHNDIPNQSLQSRYNVLFSGDNLAASGNLLITFSPATVPAREQELDYLLFWLSQGNDMLLLRADSDAPPWSLTAKRTHTTDLLGQMGFQLLVEDTAQQSQHEDQGKDQPTVAERLRALGKQMDNMNYQDITLTPLPFHPLSQNVSQIAARTIPMLQPPTRLLGIDWPRSALVLLRDAQQRAAMWEARVGQGRLWVSRFADLFGNVSLGQKDNAAFIANLIQASLKPGGQVIFDDMHFGVSSLYDPKAFFGDSRLHNSLWFILGFWLLYVVGYGNRFTPFKVGEQRNARQTIQSVDFTYAVGGYFARRLTHRSAALALFQHFFNDVRAYYKKPLNGEPVWELLQGHPRVNAQTVDRLQALYNSVARKRKFNLVKLRNQLLTVRNQIHP